MKKNNTTKSSSFEVTLDGTIYTRRPNGLWTPKDRPWEKVVGAEEAKLEGLYAEAKEKGQAQAKAKAEKAQAMKEAFKIANMDIDEWFERVYG